MCTFACADGMICLLNDRPVFIDPAGSAVPKQSPQFTSPSSITSTVWPATPWSITSQSQVGGGYENWRAFDRVTSNRWAASRNLYGTNGTTGTKAWLTIMYPTPQTIRSYSILCTGNGTDFINPTSWDLRGSNDNSLFTVLHSVTAYTSWSTTSEPTYTVSTMSAYRCFSLLIHETASSASSVRYLCINEIKLFTT